jgi:hypothetical protein
MSKLKIELEKACAELGLSVKFDERISVNGKDNLKPLAHIESIGAPNGMLIFLSFEPIRSAGQDLCKQQFAYSVLSEPRPNEKFDLNSYKEMFVDWGWSGSPDAKPAWLTS